MNGSLTGSDDVGTASSYITSTDTTRKVVIGKPWFSDSWPLIQATLDELRIYERMLSPEEIQAQGKHNRKGVIFLFIFIFSYRYGNHLKTDRGTIENR